MVNEVYEIPLNQIETDPQQPRKLFDDVSLNELARSIKQYGLIQPISVKPNSERKFVIIHGERRYKAHQLAGLPTIRCIVSDLETETIDNVRLIENIMREDLTPLELANEFKKRIDAGQTHQDIADAINKSRAYVTQRLLLLELPQDQQNALTNGEITFAEARSAAKGGGSSSRGSGGCYGVTIEDLEVPQYLKDNGYTVTNLEELYKAYRADLATIRKALLKGGSQL